MVLFSSIYGLSHQARAMERIRLPPSDGPSLRICDPPGYSRTSMSDQPSNQDPGAEQPESEDTTRRDSEAMLRGKPTQDPLVATTVDQYSIKRVIGEGGMGVVYEALQQSPRRTVALKMMKRGVTSKSAMRRFEYEAQTLGRLRHDGIAQIYQAGTFDRWVFFH